jgi:UDP-N-acetylglucosamine 2-epimerase (non-hydrolysing)/GDP/UDP-N,N'-diacetylbacillosamine 2-epimerase (hydrolysing)
MSAKRRICVVTGSRAEYGLLFWLLRELRDAADVQLQLVVTGMHLSPEFGYTARTIEDDGFTVDAKVEMLLSGDSAAAITKSTGLGVIGFADAFERLRPDVLVVLGDRFEILAAAQAAFLARIPIAHLHGGEATEGALDDGIRHAITKMSQLHFVAAEPYRRRVVQMGERPERVFNFGAPGLDQLRNLQWLDRAGLEQALGMPLPQPLFVVTYHPVTLAERSPAEPMRELLAALDRFANASIVVTYPNADQNGRVVIGLIDEYVRTRAPRVRAFASLGQRNYLSLMRECSVVIGNSSSGLIEAPALRKATVNIGDRQRGRLRATSVIDCDEQADAIAAAIQRALGAEFQATLAGVQSQYGHGGASAEIVKVLRTTPLAGLLQKGFRDL